MEVLPLAVMTLIRMGRGQMIGLDHNKNMEWVGSSLGFSLRHVILDRFRLYRHELYRVARLERLC